MFYIDKKVPVDLQCCKPSSMQWRYKMKPLLYLSDSKNLVQAIREGDVTDTPPWRATETIQECLNLLKPNQVAVQYITRKAVQTTHEMTNWAKVTRTEFLFTT